MFLNHCCKCMARYKLIIRIGWLMWCCSKLRKRSLDQIAFFPDYGWLKVQPTARSLERMFYTSILFFFILFQGFCVPKRTLRQPNTKSRKPSCAWLRQAPLAAAPGEAAARKVDTLHIESAIAQQLHKIGIQSSGVYIHIYICKVLGFYKHFTY